jgi:hypothetical protein
MGVLGSDISVVMSGGSSNADPDLCLGGDPSGTPITGYLNNLFNNESEDDSANGKTDYRCIYIFNDNSTDTFYSVKVWIFSQVEGGASIKLGVPTVSDTQVITISGTVSGGSIIFSHGTKTFTVAGSPSPTVLALNIQTALAAVPSCSGVTVTPLAVTGGVAYTVSFLPGRHHDTLAVMTNSLTGTSVSVNIIKTLNGGPINQIASPISSSATPPTGVTFTLPTIENPVLLGDLQPLDGFPVWVQRNCPAGAVGVPNDGAVIRVTGKPFSSG